MLHRSGCLLVLRLFLDRRWAASNTYEVRDKIFERFFSQQKYTNIGRKMTRAVDPHSFFADPDPAVFLNADPDPAA